MNDTEERGFDWRYYAACRAHPEPTLWDEGIEGVRESRHTKAARHGRAIEICDNECAVKAQCKAAINRELDEGVRAGRRLKPLEKPGRYGEVDGTSRRKRAS